MGTLADKLRLFELLYDAKQAASDEKATAWDLFNKELDRVRAGTVYSRSQVVELLHRDGYQDYAKRRRLADRANL